MNPRTHKRLVRAAIEAVLNWYCHDDSPPPAWWRRAGPYKDILQVLEHGEDERCGEVEAAAGI